MFKKVIWAMTLLSVVALFNACSGGSDDAGCGKIKNVTFQANPTVVYISFESPSDANSFRVEYGPTGFIEGTGQFFMSSSQQVTVQNLSPNTTYDFYIKTICSAESSGKSYKLSSVTTAPSNCTGTVDMTIYQYVSNSAELTFSYTGGSPEKYEVEYGLQGFTRGNGTLRTVENNNYIMASNLQPNTAYDFYIRAVCWGNDGSPWKKIQYTTATSCPKPTNLNSYWISGSCNSLSEKRAFTWSGNADAVTYTMVVVTNSNINNPNSAQPFTVSNPSITLQNLSCSYEAFYVKANCGDGTSSAWAGPYYW